MQKNFFNFLTVMVILAGLLTGCAGRLAKIEGRVTALEGWTESATATITANTDAISTSAVLLAELRVAVVDPNGAVGMLQKGMGGLETRINTRVATLEMEISSIRGGLHKTNAEISRLTSRVATSHTASRVASTCAEVATSLAEKNPDIKVIWITGFAKGKTKLEKAQLEQIETALSSPADTYLAEAIGFSSPEGSDSANERIGLARATSAAYMSTSKGVDTTTAVTKYGGVWERKVLLIFRKKTDPAPSSNPQTDPNQGP